MATRKVKICVDGRKYLVTGMSGEIFEKDFLCSLAGGEKDLNKKLLELAKKSQSNLGQIDACNQLSRENYIENTRNQEASVIGSKSLSSKAGIVFEISSQTNKSSGLSCKENKLPPKNEERKQNLSKERECGKQKSKKVLKKKTTIEQGFKSKKKPARKEAKTDFIVKNKSESKEDKSRSELASKTSRNNISVDGNSEEGIKKESPESKELINNIEKIEDEFEKNNNASTSKSNLEEKDFNSPKTLFDDKINPEEDKMSFACSREQWIEELRKKSPLYAMQDENQNYLDLKKSDRSDSEADIDSGIPSIDGDTPQEKILTRRLIEEELFLLRQDSGVSSEGAENTSTTQLYFDALATEHKRLPSKNLGQQVVFNCRYDVIREKNHLRSNEDLIDKSASQNRNENAATSNKDSITTRKRNSFGKECNLLEEKPDSLMTICNYKSKIAGGSDLAVSTSDAYFMTENNNIGLKSDLTQSACSIKSTGNQDPIVLNNRKDTFISIDENLSKSNQKRISSEHGGIKSSSEVNDSGNSHRDTVLRMQTKNHESNSTTTNDTRREEIWKEYLALTKSLSDAVDQLLYKDLMTAHLTSDILNFSDNNISIEDDLLELEDKYIHDEIFTTASLLQTSELITEQQCMEEHVLAKHIQRTNHEIEEKRMIVQVLERLYRSTKYRSMPKQLKRYCSVESLMSDVGNEKQEHLEVVFDAEETFEEEISLV